MHNGDEKKLATPGSSNLIVEGGTTTCACHARATTACPSGVHRNTPRLSPRSSHEGNHELIEPHDITEKSGWQADLPLRLSTSAAPGGFSTGIAVLLRNKNQEDGLSKH
jgi:hypothetical protein